MDEYKYILKYRYKDEELTMEFDADVDVNIMCDKLVRFLLGCGWSEKILKKVIKGGIY